MDTGILGPKLLPQDRPATVQALAKALAGKRPFSPTRILAELMPELIFKVRRLIWIRTQITICTGQALRSARSWMVRQNRQKRRSRSSRRSKRLRANKKLQRQTVETLVSPGLASFLCLIGIRGVQKDYQRSLPEKSD